MEGGSNGTSCMMAFGENSNNGLVCPMMMMMPLITTTSTISTTSSPSHSHHHHHHHNQHHHQHHNHSPNPNISDTTNMISSVFLPLPHNHHHHNRNSTSTTTGSSSLNINNNNMLDNHHHNNNNNNISTSTYFHMVDHDDHNHQINTTTTTTDHCNTSVSSFKAKIMAHPHYQRLLASYVNCQKVGAPPEVVARLEAACGSAAAAAMGHVSRGCLGEDPALDQFMEAYCEMLSKYEQELSKPFKEAMLFLQRIESQFKSLTVSSSDSACGEAVDRNGSSEEEVDVNNSFIDPQAEDRELKGQLLRKYSGYLGSLKQEFMKKRKKGKLPKEARQQLLDWWSRHYKWPYPSESQKLALAESTGLDQKQINNWFINQRKRHWKPSEDMQLVVMDAANPHHYYMESVLGNPFPMDISPQLL